MPAQIKIAYLDYRIDDSDSNLPAVEQHRQKALAAISQISGLGKLLQCIGVDATGVPEQLDKRRLANLIDGTNTAGELLAILADSAYASVSEMAGFIPITRPK